MIHMSVIPPEVLLDRRRKVAMGIELPKGAVELPDRGPWRTWPGMAASAVVHAGLFLAAAGLFSGGPGEATTADPTTQSGREVAMVYLEPPPAPEPEPVPEAQPPQPQPQTPVETALPSQQELPPPGPESNEVLSPAPARETNTATRDASPEEATAETRAGSDERDNIISTERVIEDGPEDLASAAAAKGTKGPTLEQEAQRIFGRPVTGTGTRNNALPWASDSTCVPDPTPIDRNSPVVLDSISGVVYDHSGMALGGAHLQVVGTSYHSFSDRGGRYSLVFDVSLVANCRVQVVRVSAGGYRGRDLYLAMGLGNNNVYMER